MMNKDQARAAINQVIATLKPIVSKIEARPALTANHYGDYMAVLGQAPAAQRTHLAACLIKAGANEQGVTDALRLTI